MAIRHSSAVQRLSSAAGHAESRSGRIGPISLGMKQMGERIAGNPQAAFTGALLDRLTHHVHILEMNGESYRLATSKKAQRRSAQGQSQTQILKIPNEGDPATKT